MGIFGHNKHLQPYMIFHSFGFSVLSIIY
jgi:hypothetical protein